VVQWLGYSASVKSLVSC